LAITIAFSPTFSAGFVTWDDGEYVVHNRLLRDFEGLTRIWNPSTRLPQYYPVTFTSFWVEYRLWGLSPAGYHATNVLLHALNSVLVLSLVRNLGASPWVAMGTAAVFALHPVQVESVAWVTERKNTLSAFFYLAAFLLYLRHRKLGSRSIYALSLLCFSAGLLAKTQTLTLPIVLGLSEWLFPLRQTKERAREKAARIAPFLVLACLAAGVTTIKEKQVTTVWAELPALSERPLIAAAAAWFYVGKFLVPIGLAPIYPKWTVSWTELQWWIGLVAWIVALVALVASRGHLPRLALWGIGFFLVSLLPSLGLFPYMYQHYSYVADRFLYLPCIGGGLVVAEVLSRIRSPASRLGSATGVVLVLLVLTCGALTHRQCQNWQTNLRFWQHVLKRNPDSYPANINLGNYHAAQNDWNAALPYYRRAAELGPTHDNAFTSYIKALGIARGPEAVIEASEKKLSENPTWAYAVYFNRAVAYEQMKDWAAALKDYRRVIELSPPDSKLLPKARARIERLSGTTGRPLRTSAHAPKMELAGSDAQSFARGMSEGLKNETRRGDDRRGPAGEDRTSRGSPPDM
jgi:succinate dehydrogenase hydrophobic anchor subunit